MPNEHKLIFNFIHNTYFLKDKKKIMIDIGLYDEKYILPYISKKWNCHAFEPIPSQFNKLKKKIGSHVILNNKAVDICSNQIKEFYSGPTMGTSSLIKFTKVHKLLCKVNTIRLDDYLKEKTIKNVTYLKIDTEGNDLPILKSINFNECSPILIMSEYEK